MSTPGPVRLGVRHFALAAFLLTLILGTAAEVAFRFYQKARFGISLTTWIPSLPERQFPLSPFLVFGPRVDWDVPGKEGLSTAHFNAQGFRSPGPVQPKQPGELRIVTLGGSTTEDLWNDAGIHWPLVMECRLRQAGRTDVHVLNGGMSAYTSAHTLVRFELDVLAYDPDLLIVMENINDLSVPYLAALTGARVDQNYLVSYGRKPLTGVVEQDDVIPIRVLRALRNQIRPDPPRQPLIGPVDVEPGAALFERNLTSTSAIAAVHGVQLVLLTMPTADSDSLYYYTRNGWNAGAVTVGPLPEDYAEYQADFARYNRGVEKVGEKARVPVIRMHQLMDRSPSNFADVVHLTTAGTLRFGEIMADSLLPHLPASGAPLAPFDPSDPACDWESAPQSITQRP